MFQGLAITASCLAAIALIARRVEHTPLTVPVLCLAAGALVETSGLVDLTSFDRPLEIVAEAALAVLLFADAAGVRLASLKAVGHWPGRMLLFGIPLALLLGLLAAMSLLNLGIWEAALIAAILIPTDAALGKAVFDNSAIPARLRDGLLAESGLNDGIALPLIIFLACGMVGFDHEVFQGNWLWFAVSQIGGGLLVGSVLGASGGWMLAAALQRNWTDEEAASICALALVAAIFAFAHLIGGNGFVAAFTGGLVFGRAAGPCRRVVRRFMNAEGALLTMTAFFFIGAVMLPASEADWSILALVAVSILVIRPLAIWIALWRSDADRKMRLVLGWFGPRGLATALFSLMVLREFEDIPIAPTLLTTASIAVVVSALLHGVTAHYASWLFDESE